MKFNTRLALVSALMVFGASFANAAATLKIGPKGEQLLFDVTTFTVKAGEKVKVVFKNVSSMPHNWVLVAPGTADKVAQDSIAAGADKGWLAMGPNVLAHTKMVDPKKTETMEFTAPAKAGSYPYICTFPGHGMTMRGTLVVK